MTKYRNAIVKFNGGRGALLCNQCSIILAYGVRHKDVEHYCRDCEKVRNEENGRKKWAMITYNINWMGPVNMDWYRERGLTRQVSEVLEKDQAFGFFKAGDTWTYEDITEPYACGRIDIRDSTKEGYDGWDEYDLEPMHSEDWNALSEYLWDLTTEHVLSYDELIAGFEEQYGKKIRWWDEEKKNSMVLDCDSNV